MRESLENQFGAEKARLKSKVSAGLPNVSELRRRLKNLMWYKAGIVRHGNGLGEALEEIEEIKSSIDRTRIETSKELVKSLELRNMLTLGEMVCRAALMRTESRGSHYRSDFPQEDNASWQKNIVIRKDNSVMQLKALPVSFQHEFP